MTVNEALSRLDALAASTAESRTIPAPPADAAEGALYVVPGDAAEEWAGHVGEIAFRVNGGWFFRRPEAGSRIHLRDEGVDLVHDGASWIASGEFSRAGAATAFRVATLDHAVAPGAASLTEVAIPDKAIVFGVTARVTTPLLGDGLTQWRLGAEGASGRYGGGYGCSAGSYAVGVTSAPLAYFGGTRLLLEAMDGSFLSGAVRLCVHYAELTPPSVL